ncbi:U2 snRNP-associated SURP motif-containing protein-like [Onthophagus taurus]|uniref:U2 snRNP-associated SURP motif-containing protein-like n=1 Tax=Onthophagus taurus TaxID=166361 RepID=UPI000C1FDB79|nr:U2 snRNP-associated SURP motif-containing protein-like [Onthophagus taurus]
MSKRDLERKQREEQEATAYAFQEFIQTFQDNSTPPNKLFVKSGILYAKDKENEHDKGKIYNPKPVLRHHGNQETIKKAIECATLLRDTRNERIKSGKPKSNLELLKEELRQRHIERDERLKIRNESSTQNLVCFESDDVSTTNLFVANINVNITEQDLMKIFGVYGPLASVKIMWPRNEERGRSNVGFVAYMSRKDGERALECLKNRDDMRVGWAKPVELPQHPVYIPPELLKLLLPPPQTGLPFNAHIKSDILRNKENIDDVLKDAYVTVTIPLDKKFLATIHRMVEFVVKEGPLFEAMIMNKEINNSMFQFLFDNKSPNHIYYRWKLYSVLNGESVYEWSNKEFRMFKNGSVWIPPITPNYSLGMPDNLVKNEKDDKKTLSQAQRNRLINYIQNLNSSRIKIGETMIFCINHEIAAKDISILIAESFENAATNPLKKIARLYLISDVLYNSYIKKGGGGKMTYINEFRRHLKKIFENLEKSCDALKYDKDKDDFKNRILKVIHSWNIWKIYPNEFLRRLEKLFIKTIEIDVNDDSENDEPLDGQNLIKRSLLKNEIKTDLAISADVTILPTAIAKRNSQPNQSDFVQSKWESVDPQDIEAQAMSTKQIYNMELERQMKELKSQLNQITEEERGNLRRIEVMVMQYQDELESGKRKRRKGKNLEEDVNLYRKELLEKNKNVEYKRRLSPISSDSFSSDEDKKESKKKKFGRKDRKERYQRYKK